MLTREEEKACYAELHRQEENSTCRALDRTVTLEEVGQLVQQTAEKLFEGDWNEATEQFIELHDRLFPEGFQPAPAEEVTVLEPAPPADYLILQDDDLINPHRSEAETLELLRDVQNQILDGEREPEDFLEALELMYRISHGEQSRYCQSWPPLWPVPLVKVPYLPEPLLRLSGEKTLTIC